MFPYWYNPLWLLRKGMYWYHNTIVMQCWTTKQLKLVSEAVYKIQFTVHQCVKIKSHLKKFINLV